MRGVAVCAAIWMHCINKVTNMPMLGGWVGGPDDRFGPLKDLAYCDLCRPSDIVLTHYQLFAEARPPCCRTLQTATPAARPTPGRCTASCCADAHPLCRCTWRVAASAVLPVSRVMPLVPMRQHHCEASRCHLR